MPNLNLENTAARMQIHPCIVHKETLKWEDVSPPHELSWAKSREAVCSAVSSRVRRNFGEKFASRGREENIQHVWYFLPREANPSSFAATVRIWLGPINRSSNKIAWPTHVISELGSKRRWRWKRWLFKLFFYFDKSVIEEKLTAQRHGRE